MDGTVRRIATAALAYAFGAAAAGTAAPPAGGTATDSVFYVDGGAGLELHAARRLADGTLLVGGGAERLPPLPAAARRIELGGFAPDAGASGRTAFLLHLAADLRSVLAVATFPAGAATEVRTIRGTEIPGQPAGDLFVSGGRAGEPGGRTGSRYFIARLDGNFVARPPARALWVRSFGVDGALAGDPPWDVGSDGRVVCAHGDAHGYNWVAVQRLAPDGRDDVVPQWRTHWMAKPGGGEEEWAGPAAGAPRPVARSAIVLKVWDRGDFRSWTREDFLARSSDGNGGEKQGRWPFDAMFEGFFDPATRKTVAVTGTGRGYFGYRWSSTPCANVGAIAVDRRDNSFYLGGNNKSRLPDGNPDFEPWVVAMGPDGAPRWWQRLYPESKGVSTPDQYVDALAVDYARPPEREGALVAVARAHGNNVNNYWTGDAIRHPLSPKRSFQKGFTGTSGNIHYQWIGRMTLREGTMLHATYLAECGEGGKGAGSKPFDDPLLRHWPSFESGWPDLNTTRIRPHGLALDATGRVYVAAVGRRVVTTSNAFQPAPDLLANRAAKGQWGNFARVYLPDLTSLAYSSVLSGAWDWESGEGQSPVELRGLCPVPGGVLVVGFAPPDKKTGLPAGNEMPTRNVPAWGATRRTGQAGVVALWHF